MHETIPPLGLDSVCKMDEGKKTKRNFVISCQSDGNFEDMQAAAGERGAVSFARWN